MNIAVPTDYIRPTVRFDLTDQERETLTTAQGVLAVASADDLAAMMEAIQNPENNPTDETMMIAQSSMLLIGRIMSTALRVGNSVENAHLAAISMLSEQPNRTESIALNWARPDLSDLTGEPIDDPTPDLPDHIQRMIKRVERTFLHTAVKMPMSAGWAKLGVELGFDGEKVAAAAGSILDFSYIFSDITCNCSYCTEED